MAQPVGVAGQTSVGSGLKAVGRAVAPKPRPVAPAPVSVGAALGSVGQAVAAPAAQVATAVAHGVSLPQLGAGSGLKALGSAVSPQQQTRQRLVNALVKQRNPNLWDVNPLSVGGWKIGQADMGVDANAPVGAPILAPNNAVVTHIDPNWYQGQPQVTMRLTSGPNKGSFIYLAEQIANIPQVGQTIKRGQPIARYAPSGTGIEMGIAADAQGTTLAAAHGNSAYAVRHAPGGTPEGQQFISTFIKKGVKPGVVPSGNPPGGGSANNPSGPAVPQTVTPTVFAVALIKSLGIKPTATNVSNMVAWENQEGGHWANSAKFNPLNTTEGAPGSSTFQSVGAGSAPIRIYTSWDQGLKATTATLNNGLYGPIKAALANNVPLSQFSQAVSSTKWGTGPVGGSAPSVSSGTVAQLARTVNGLPSSAFSGGGSAGASASGSSGSASSSGGGGQTVDGFPVSNQQQANAAQMTANIAGLGSFPAGNSEQQRKMNLLGSFLKGQAGSSNPFNAVGGSRSAGEFSLPGGMGLALSSLQRLAGGTQLTVPGSRKKLF